MTQYAKKKTIPELLANVGQHETHTKIGNNRLHVNYGNGVEEYRLHHTAVATVDRIKRTLTLNCDGWHTRTTATAMEEGAGMLAGISIRTQIKGGKIHVVRDRDFAGIQSLGLEGRLTLHY